MNGALVYQDYLNLIKKKQIVNQNIEKRQIQPSSIDLSLSEECYEIKHSFLAYNSKVRNKLKKYSSVNRYRLTVSRSSKNISAQIIDDFKKITLLSATSNQKLLNLQKNKIITHMSYSQIAIARNAIKIPSP